MTSEANGKNNNATETLKIVAESKWRSANNMRLTAPAHAGRKMGKAVTFCVEGTVNIAGDKECLISAD